jgi:hypothetical protein
MQGFEAWIAAALAAVGALGLGAWLGAAWQKNAIAKRDLANRKIPAKWPLAARACLNSRERTAWHWLRYSLAEHDTLIKTPITRFMMGDNTPGAADLFPLLSGLYATFTVIDKEGNALAFVDLQGSSGADARGRLLKESLIKHVKRPYVLLDPERLPDVNAFRQQVIGVSRAVANQAKADTPAAKAVQAAAAGDWDAAQAELRAAVERRRRKEQGVAVAAEGPAARAAALHEQMLDAPRGDHIAERMPDSFIMGLEDSRRMPL